MLLNQPILRGTEVGRSSCENFHMKESRHADEVALLGCLGRAREHGTKFHILLRSKLAELVELLPREAKLQIDE